MKHTPEPWAISSTDPFLIVDRHGNDVAAALSIYSAARIVACVNACKGLTNEELKTLPVFNNAISQSVFFYNSILPDVKIWLETGRCKEYMMRYNLDMYLALQGIANTLSDKVSLRIDDHNGFACFKRK
jgi:hypothetical protein